jgi:hypothetical protein
MSFYRNSDCCKDCPNKNNQVCHCTLPYLPFNMPGDKEVRYSLSDHTEVEE